MYHISICVLIFAFIKAAFLYPELMDHHYKTEHDNDLIFTMMSIMAKASNGEGEGKPLNQVEVLGPGPSIPSPLSWVCICFI